MEYLLAIEERPFLNSLKIDGPSKLPLGGGVSRYHFSIQVDGKIRTYNSIFSDLKLISKTNNKDLIQYCKLLKKSRLILLYSIGILGLILVINSSIQ